MCTKGWNHVQGMLIEHQVKVEETSVKLVRIMHCEVGVQEGEVGFYKESLLRTQMLIHEGNISMS